METPGAPVFVQYAALESAQPAALCLHNPADCSDLLFLSILMSHHFPQTTAASQAHEIAQLIMEGFDRHYQLFRAESTKAKHRFEAQDWHGQQQGQRERIAFYDLRVQECEHKLAQQFQIGSDLLPENSPELN